MEILSLAGSLIASFIIFYIVIIGTIILLFKLLFKPIPEDELIEDEKVLPIKKVKRSSRKSFQPTHLMAK
jgi:hypothetical protein